MLQKPYVISGDLEKIIFDKIHHLFTIKTVSKLGILTSYLMARD